MSLTLANLPEIVALAAVLVAWRGVWPAARQSPVAARLRTVYLVIAGLMALRLLAVKLGAAFIIAGYMVFAAWLPLAALLLVEELRRRHAPRFIKLACLGGALAFSFIAVSFGLVWSEAALIALATFQALAAAAMAALLVGSRGEMSLVERRVSDTFLLAIVLTIPLALTDFVALLPAAPIRGGAFAAVILVLATSRLARGDGTPLRLLSDIALCLGGAGLAAYASWLIAAGAPQAMTVVAGAAAGFLVAALALLVERFASIRAHDERLVSALARAPDAAGADELARSHPLLATGRVVDGGLLADYPDSVVAGLAGHRVIDAEIADEALRDAARDLLRASAATHLLRLSAAPARFLAVSAGELADPVLKDELVIAAMLIETRADTKAGRT